MKQFNLEEYLRNPSKKVITRDGRSVIIRCANYTSEQFIIAEIEGINYSELFTKDGKYHNSNGESSNDLFFVSEKKEGWVNILKGTIHDYYVGDSRVFESKEEAEKAGKDWNGYIPVKIEWEE